MIFLDVSSLVEKLLSLPKFPELHVDKIDRDAATVHDFWVGRIRTARIDDYEQIKPLYAVLK
jgi:hypothetical protein